MSWACACGGPGVEFCTRCTLLTMIDDGLERNGTMKGKRYSDYSMETIQRSAAPITYIPYQVNACYGRLAFVITVDCACGSQTEHGEIGYGEVVTCPECGRSSVFTWRPIVSLVVN